MDLTRLVFSRLIFNLKEALNNKNYRFVVIGYMLTNIACGTLENVSGMHV